MQISAQITGDGKAYTIYFNRDLLAKKQEKYQAKGATLIVGGTQMMAPAIAGITKPSLFQKEGLGPAKVKKSAKVAKSLLEPVAKKIKPVKVPRIKKPKPVKLKRGRVGPEAKPVVNLTTGTYYDSMKEAAAACGGSWCGISRQIRADGSRKSHRGMVHRFATPAEITAKKMLTV